MIQGVKGSILNVLRYTGLMLIRERKGFLGEVHRERKGLDSSLSSLQDELCLVTVSSQQQGLLALTRVLLDGRLQGKEWGEL